MGLDGRGRQREACGQGWKVTLRVQLRAQKRPHLSGPGSTHANHAGWRPGLRNSGAAREVSHSSGRGIVFPWPDRGGATGRCGASRSTHLRFTIKVEHGHRGEDVISTCGRNETRAARRHHHIHSRTWIGRKMEFSRLQCPNTAALAYAFPSFKSLRFSTTQRLSPPFAHALSPLHLSPLCHSKLECTACVCKIKNKKKRKEAKREK